MLENGAPVEFRLQGEHLVLSTPFGPDEPIYAASARHFFLKSEDATLEFSNETPAAAITIVLPMARLRGTRAVRAAN